MNKNSVHVPISKIEWLMLFRKIITVFSPNHTNSKTLTYRLLKQLAHVITSTFQTVSEHFRCRLIFKLFRYYLLPSLSAVADREVDIQAIIFVNIFLYSENTG